MDILRSKLLVNLVRKAYVFYYLRGLAFNSNYIRITTLGVITIF